MNPNPFFGVFLHAVGGLAAASFYLPYKRVRGWAWENYWLAGGFVSWIAAPALLAALIVPRTPAILAAVSGGVLLRTWLFGVLWGIGGLTFGLTMRYLGIALGYALALGLCAAFGTIIPPLFAGEMPAIAASVSGQVTLLGVLVCLAGIALSGRAGMLKERELSEDQKKSTVREFSFTRGVLMAVAAGVMSACMAFGFAAGKPIGMLAVEMGSPATFRNLPVLVVILLGGFTTNAAWCLCLILKGGSLGQYAGRSVAGGGAALLSNYLFCAAAGFTWYLQFFFYGMGTTKMGKYDFSSWTLHMASIIIFSTCWGILLKEWQGTSRMSCCYIASGLAVLIFSTLVIGYGNYLAE